MYIRKKYQPYNTVTYCLGHFIILNQIKSAVSRFLFIARSKMLIKERVDSFHSLFEFIVISLSFSVTIGDF